MKITVTDNPQAVRFANVEVRKPVTNDVIAAEMLVDGKSPMSMFLALMATCCTFDGEKKTFEELKYLDGWDFFELLASISPATAEELARQLSTSVKGGESR